MDIDTEPERKGLVGGIAVLDDRIDAALTRWAQIPAAICIAHDASRLTEKSGGAMARAA